MTDPVRVLVVDDDALFRTGVRMILDADPGLEVVEVLPDGQAAVDHLAEHRDDVDVVLMDADMPCLDGMEATRAIVEPGRDRPKVLILTTHTLDDYLYGAILAGASGFLLKDTSPDALRSAIVTAHQGTAVVSPEMTGRLMRSVVPRPGNGGGPDPALLDELTAREREVLELIGQGRNNSEIAAELFIAEVTVKTHVGHVLRKLRLRDRIQAVVLAHRLGLVGPDATDG